MEYGVDQHEAAAFRGAQLGIEIDALVVGLAVAAPVAILLLPIWFVIWLVFVARRGRLWPIETT